MPASFQLLELDAFAGAPVGGKAEGLARLTVMGLRVPEAVAVVGLDPSADVSERTRCARSLCERFGPGRLAVRSSAIGEDGVEASFAGQYETVLDVEGAGALADAIVESNEAESGSKVGRAVAASERRAEGDGAG